MGGSWDVDTKLLGPLGAECGGTAGDLVGGAAGGFLVGVGGGADGVDCVAEDVCGGTRGGEVLD